MGIYIWQHKNEKVKIANQALYFHNFDDFKMAVKFGTTYCIENLTCSENILNSSCFKPQMIKLTLNFGEVGKRYETF